MHARLNGKVFEMEDGTMGIVPRVQAIQKSGELERRPHAASTLEISGMAVMRESNM